MLDDRPFQLKEFLRTSHKYLQIGAAVDVKYEVIYAVGSGSAAATVTKLYRSVTSMFPDVRMTREANFREHLLESVNRAKRDSAYILFAVDDVLFYDNFDLSTATDVLENDPTTFAFHLKLHPDVVSCHTVGASVRVPSFTASHSASRSFVHEPGLQAAEAKNERCGTTLEGGNVATTSSGCLRFVRSEGSLDWDYPWDLCCSLYRPKDASTIIAAIVERHGFSGLDHPNRLEANGAALIRQLESQQAKKTGLAVDPSRPQEQSVLNMISMRPRCACPLVSVMSVVTVNRVQSIFKNPVYDFTGGSSESLARAMERDPFMQFDDTYYRTTLHQSVHIGDFVLREADEEKSMRASPLSENSSSCKRQTATEPRVSVIMPVFNGEAHLEEAIRSILCQTMKSLELIIINDGSADSSGDIADRQASMDKRVRVVHLADNVGVAKALDAGISVARGDLIARMDADDVSLTERLERQAAFLDRNPDIMLVGSAVELFFENESVGSSSIPSDGKHALESKVFIYPQTSADIHWHMHFNCAIAHPTVLCRRSLLAEETYFAAPEDGGDLVSQARSRAEDYALWVRLGKKEVPLRRFANMSSVLVRLRRHPGSISQSKREEQSLESLKIAASAWQDKLGRPVSVELMKRLRQPSLSTAMPELTEVAIYLQNLENVLKSMWKENTRAIQKIEQRTTDRLGEVAMLAMQKYGATSMSLWLTWQKRCNLQKANH